RAAHRALARNLTALLHGDEELRRAEVAAEALFSGDVRKLDEKMLAEVFADVPHSQHPRTELEGQGIALADVLSQTTLASSKREAREFLSSGAVAVNGGKVDAAYRLTTRDLLHGRTILLKRGKKNWHAT